MFKRLGTAVQHFSYVFSPNPNVRRMSSIIEPIAKKLKSSKVSTDVNVNMQSRFWVTHTIIFLIRQTMGTHSGTFHADEALGIALLRKTEEYKDASLTRTRDNKIRTYCIDDSQTRLATDVYFVTCLQLTRSTLSLMSVPCTTLLVTDTITTKKSLTRYLETERSLTRPPRLLVENWKRAKSSPSSSAQPV